MILYSVDCASKSTVIIQKLMKSVQKHVAHVRAHDQWIYLVIGFTKKGKNVITMLNRFYDANIRVLSEGIRIGFKIRKILMLETEYVGDKFEIMVTDCWHHHQNCQYGQGIDDSTIWLQTYTRGNLIRKKGFFQFFLARPPSQCSLSFSIRVAHARPFESLLSRKF